MVVGVGVGVCVTGVSGIDYVGVVMIVVVVDVE